MSDQSPGSDFLCLDTRQAPVRGRSAWLSGEIRAAITRGVLEPGAVLPSTRTLAADLGVSRGTVVAAYQELTDGGWLRARVGSATVVADPGPAPSPRPAGPPPAAPSARRPAPQSEPKWAAAREPKWALPSEPESALPSEPTSASVPDLPSAWRVTDVTARWDLTPGRPDLSFLPRAQWLRAERAAIRELASRDFSYPDPQGDRVLRAELAGMLRRTRGLAVTAADVIVTAGVSQATALLLELMRRGGATTLAVEDPGSRGLHDHVRHWGLRLHSVPVDSDGLVTDALGSADGVLLTPAHQFPTGAVLSPQRRHAVIQWARGADRLIIEDDYDAEHRYDRTPVGALQALATDRVAYVGSVSKTLAPGLRLGWLVPPSHLLTPLVAHRDASDRGSPVLPQRALAILLSSGLIGRHLRTVRIRQRRRRDALIDGLAAVPHRGEIRGVAAGLHLLLRFPDGLDDVRVAQRLAERGVLVDPLSVHRIQPGPPGLVIGYAAHSVDEIRQAGTVIAEVVARS